MEAASDIFLGWERLTGPDGQDRDFHVRQCATGRPRRTPRPCAQGDGGLRQAVRLDAGPGSRRSGDRIAIAAYPGKGDGFDRPIGEDAGAYADQNERDHWALRTAVKGGRVKATAGC